jgi:hypothetical protein
MGIVFGCWGLVLEIREDRGAHCRSLHYAPPDFLLTLVALVHFMRLSLTERRTRRHVQCGVAGNPGTLRSGGQRGEWCFQGRVVSG